VVLASELTYEGTGRSLATEQGKLHYHEAGDGAPLLCLHGSGPGVNGWANFRGNLPVFAKRFRTLILDLPGFGESDATDGHPVADAPAAVGRFLDGMGIDKVSILGNSMGGGIGARFAAEHPDRVERIAAIGGVGVSLLNPSPAEGIQLLIEFTEQPTRDRLVAWLRSMVYDQSLVTDELIEDRWVRATDPAQLESSRKIYSRAAFTAAMKRTSDPSAPPAWLYLRRITAPTLVLWGRDDRVTPLDGALVPMRLIPKCELHVFYNCGHWAMIERKDEFENVVMAFFSRG
jgi:pimeloyl-ACP methyl ester carboxylesterase